MSLAAGDCHHRRHFMVDSWGIQREIHGIWYLRIWESEVNPKLIVVFVCTQPFGGLVPDTERFWPTRAAALTNDGMLVDYFQTISPPKKSQIWLMYPWKVYRPKKPAEKDDFTVQKGRNESWTFLGLNMWDIVKFARRKIWLKSGCWWVACFRTNP